MEILELSPDFLTFVICFLPRRKGRDGSFVPTCGLSTHHPWFKKSRFVFSLLLKRYCYSRDIFGSRMDKGQARKIVESANRKMN